ncbi:MAG: type 4a pilus biogenesis protein PilO [Candidatus Omnitrophica bacterium]|nr:type 4a pilus biogenesis protein PilO [Candidatus Omnitrophota bacterium]
MAIEIPDLSMVKKYLKDEKVRKISFLGITVSFAVLYLLIFIVPVFTGFMNMRREIKTLEDEIDMVNNRVKMINNMTLKLQTLQDELDSYSKGLPEQKEITKFLEELSSVAKTAGVKILSITPLDIKDTLDPEAREYYKEMPINVTAQSGYHQLGQFVSDLENGERFISIENLNIQMNKKSPRKHNVELMLKTYVSVYE